MPAKSAVEVYGKGKIIKYSPVDENEAIIVFLDSSNDKEVEATCQHKQMIQVLDKAYGDVICDGGTINLTAIYGRHVLYGINVMGFLSAFSPLGAKELKL